MTRQQQDLKCLDQLIADFGGIAGVREHLQAARRYLLGSAAGEYALSLELARESAGSVSNKAKRTEFKEILRELIAPGGRGGEPNAAATEIPHPGTVQPVTAH